MLGLSTFSLAIGSLIEHPLRTLLTALGVIIGVSAVYFTLGIGEGSRQGILEELDSLQARSMSVYQDRSRRGRSSVQRAWKPFSESDIEQIREISGVYGATGALSRNVTAFNENSDWQTEVNGIDLDYMKTKGYEIAQGQAINSADIERRETVAVIGQTVLNTLFRGENPIGARIKLDNVPFIIKGVMAPVAETSFRGQDLDNTILIPRTTARNRVFGGNFLVRDYVNGINIAAMDQDELTRIEREVGFLLRQSRGLTTNDAPDYRIFNFSANRQARNRADQAIGLLVAIIGSVVLFVGGVGVMNIMLVSVTERTREIGLRMALGARQSDILLQVMIEAVLICAISGALGLGLGHLIANFAQLPSNMSIIFSPQVALLAFSASLIIGVVFGYLPAQRAAKLNPIEALRHE